MKNEIECKEVIVSRLTRRGKGIVFDPIRIITQVFEKDGTLIAESDPSNKLFDFDDMIAFAQYCQTQQLRANAEILQSWEDCNK